VLKQHRTKAALGVKDFLLFYHRLRNKITVPQGVGKPRNFQIMYYIQYVNLDAPSWLWLSVVELMASHEAAYLDHCRRYAWDED
jgi:uncharacterized protein (DUF2252 family)